MPKNEKKVNALNEENLGQIAGGVEVDGGVRKFKQQDNPVLRGAVPQHIASGFRSRAEFEAVYFGKNKDFLNKK